MVLPNRGADEAWRQINYLIDHAYIDQHTRAVMFQFTVFNPMMHRFCSFVLVAELQPTGGVLPTGNFEVRVLHMRGDDCVLGLSLTVVYATLRDRRCNFIRRSMHVGCGGSKSSSRASTRGSWSRRFKQCAEWG